MPEMQNFSEYLLRFLEHLELDKNSSKLTIRNYEHYLRVYKEFLVKLLDRDPQVSDITLDSVRKFRLYLSRQKGTGSQMMSIKTQGYYVIALRSFLKWMIKQDLDVMQPEKIDVPIQKSSSLKFLDEDYVYRLLAAPNLSTPRGLRDKAILELLFSTGLRVSELVGLNRDKINLKTLEFNVIGKGGKSRIVFISKRAASFVGRYLASRTDHLKPLFISIPKGAKSITQTDEKSRLTARSVQRLVKKYVAQSKIPVEATPHTLRHSMATDMLRSGADIRSIQELLGHSNISTTQIYTHITNTRLREVHEKYHSGNK